MSETLHSQNHAHIAADLIDRQKGEPMTENERKTMMILADTIHGEINRMCVTKNLSELDTMCAYARKNLDKLSQLIYNAKFRQGVES